MSLPGRWKRLSSEEEDRAGANAKATAEVLITGGTKLTPGPFPSQTHHHFHSITGWASINQPWKAKVCLFACEKLCPALLFLQRAAQKFFMLKL